MNLAINQLMHYALRCGLIEERDYDYCVNQLLYLLRLDTFARVSIDEDVDFFDVMEKIVSFAANQNLIEDTLTERDHFEAKLMDVFVKKPSELDRQFMEKYRIGPKTATDFFFQLSKDTNYIKTRRIQKNRSFTYEGAYGPLQITINLSKPEKDPMEIAKADLSRRTDYPKCALCMENVGFYGTHSIASRSNHRVITVTLNHQKDAWGFQYSPYQYFNEHASVLTKAHIPMKVDHETFKELVDFINKFPHYTIGSNAGLPIVGGSILSHYHFQGGRHTFPFEAARVLARYQRRRVEVEVLDWPMSTIRVTSDNENRLLDMVDDIFDCWKTYDAPELDILSKTTEQHNTITPIVKLNGAKYQFYIVLRNNRATKARPYGLFHPREQWFHIKKENIGLIEVMGLAILPGRLERELSLIKQCLSGDTDAKNYPELDIHAHWIESLREQAYPQDELDMALDREVGRIFEAVIEDCGVFKRKDKEAFLRFVEKAIY